MPPSLNRRVATQLHIPHSYPPLEQKRISWACCILKRKGEINVLEWNGHGHTFEEFEALWTVIPTFQCEGAREGLILYTRKTTQTVKHDKGRTVGAHFPLAQQLGFFKS